MIHSGKSIMERSARRRKTVSHPPIVDQDAGLAMVMAEIIALMGSAGAVVAMDPENGFGPSLLFVDDGLRNKGHADFFLDLICAAKDEIVEGSCAWRPGPAESHLTIMLMPVQRAGGHSRLVIAVAFEKMSPDDRLRAERLYRERRPFAVGYFQLWQTNRALAQRAQSLERALDQTTIGVLLLGSDGSVIHANRTGNEILEAGDGLVRGTGLPRATHLADTVNLQAALTHVLSPTPNGGVSSQSEKTPLLALRRRAGPPLIVALFASGNPLLQPRDIAAIMYIADPSLDLSDMLFPLCKLYGLSPVETRIASYLASGQTIGEAASAMRVKEQTARGYLKSIFIKTATNRQAELVVLLLSSLIRMKDSSLQEALPFIRGEAVRGHSR